LPVRTAVQDVQKWSVLAVDRRSRTREQ